MRDQEKDATVSPTPDDIVSTNASPLLTTPTAGKVVRDSDTKKGGKEEKTETKDPT